MIKASYHFMPESWAIGFRWHKQRRALYLSLPMFVLRIHFWKPPEHKYRYGIYRVCEGGSVYHTVRAVDDADAICKTIDHLLKNVGVGEDEIGDMWVEERYHADHKITINMDDCDPITHTANEWSEIYAGKDPYLACSEW